MPASRNSPIPTIALALMVLLFPAVARADGLDGIATFLFLIAAQAVLIAVGLGAVTTALLVRGLPLWLFAMLTAAANGVMGVVLLFRESGRLGPFANICATQVTLAFFALPSLVVWRRTEPEGHDSAVAALQTPRWLLLWILGHVALGIAASLVTFPLLAALRPHEPIAAVDSLRAILVLTGFVNGALIGGLEWLLLRKSLGMSALWVPLTALATATAGFLSAALAQKLPGVVVLASAAVAVGQWPLLRQRVENAWLWILVSAAVGLVHLPAAALYLHAPAFAPVVLQVLGGLTTLLTGLCLQRLARVTTSRA
jgi:hypothetical protein